MCNIFFTIFLENFLGGIAGRFFQKLKRKCRILKRTLSLTPVNSILGVNWFAQKKPLGDSRENCGERRAQVERSPRRPLQARLLQREFAPMVLCLVSVHR